MNSQYDAIQPQDRTETATAAENRLRDRIEQQLYQENREVEAEVRTLISKAEDALVGESDADPDTLLAQAHWYLWLDPDRDDVLRTGDIEPWVRSAFHRMHRLRVKGRRPDAVNEHAVLHEIAKAQDYISGAGDRTKYAPITLEHLDKKGMRSLVDEDDLLPIGRKRMKGDSTASREYMSAAIPHMACDHILTTASPRQGKDSTNARICGNLKDQHGYKWVSILDDGRNELPMIAIPNDEDKIRQSLERLNQTPKAYDTRVYVPAMPGLPDQLPGCFELFTIGVDTLTPEIILRLTGKQSASGSTERRIKEALRTTRRGTGTAEQLIDELQSLAGEMEATVTVNELGDEDAMRDISYQMEEDETLQQAANTLAQYAADGLIEDAGAETNLEMPAILKDQDRVAALNCNFLDDGHGALQFVIMDLWMQLIWQAADEHKNIPRICLEIRELKNVAPSSPENYKYSAERSSTKQTIFEIASQGGSRGIMLVGSTQKINDVQRSIRVNMRNKIVLSNEDEGIKVLKESVNIQDLAREGKSGAEVIKDFKKGQGLIATPEWKRWPVEFAGARCGLSDKDRDWLDRYGLAWGARVREEPHDHWSRRFADVEWWIDVNTLDVHDGGEQPAIRDYYSDWYLVDHDFLDGTDPGDVDAELVECVLEDRREYPVPSDLSLYPTDRPRAERTTTIRDAEKAQEERVKNNLDEYDLPTVLEPWAYASEKKRGNMLEVLRAVRDHNVGRQRDIAKHCSVATGTVGKYISEDSELSACVVKDPKTGAWELTPVGEKALAAPWTDISA